eukprot:355040-Chlamydomonas_euryale.AAC.10
MSIEEHFHQLPIELVWAAAARNSRTERVEMTIFTTWRWCNATMRYCKSNKITPGARSNGVFGLGPIDKTAATSFDWLALAMLGNPAILQ